MYKPTILRLNPAELRTFNNVLDLIISSEFEQFKDYIDNGPHSWDLIPGELYADSTTPNKTIFRFNHYTAEGHAMMQYVSGKISYSKNKNGLTEFIRNNKVKHWFPISEEKDEQNT